jgi:serine phosphatase RsbU (regulator of sigma subunit)
MKFRDLKLGTKQSISFSIILIIMTGYSIFSIHKMSAIKSEIDQVTENWLPRAIAISQITLFTSELRRNQLQYAFTTNDSMKQELSNIMIELIDNINANQDLYTELKTKYAESPITIEDENTLYAEFERQWEIYQDLSFQFFKLSRGNKTLAAVELLNTDARDVYNDFRSKLLNLVKIHKKNVFDATKRAEDTYTNTRNIIIVLLSLTILISITLALVLVRVITIPLKQLVNAVKEVAGGNLEIRLESVSKDEIGKLTTSFDQMIDSLRGARAREQREARLRAETIELRAKATEAEAKALKAENKRKTHEIEEARKLQLSMLPKELPQLPDLEIAVYMKTATEVGGDYYDFKVKSDGTLTIAIGDATGHGLHAGTMVTATKSLFNAFADLIDPVKILNKTSLALKEMGFQGIYMAMTLAKYKNGKMILTSAGMPGTAVYRAEHRTVEEIELKGMPLGGFTDFQYQQKEINLKKGDTVLFMSDGLPETFNKQNEMFGYENAIKLFGRVANKPPQKIIEHLAKGGENWANGRAQDDDVTFLALKIK